ncbi:SAM-dependent methyltransferase [Streptomyces sp. V4-01]|uniref:SAM-dependent methyltransferase n=1 Tax=Actinacidiphila polyblastidii TaxID=3110430 RepID=A0ABU7PL84_9ACTN|nr:SAM-dependent methyltransferase [Streptomyces sp. V4-01]
MTRPGTPAAYFDRMYADADDPWHLAERWYERRKYDLTLAALPRPRYRRAFEPGCSVGELTLGLAPRCDELLAADRVAAAVRTTRRRTADLPQVSVRQLTVPDEWPAGVFDLIVLSELLYYLDDDAVGRVLRQSVESLEPEGTLVTVHWNHDVPEHLSTGDAIADRLARLPGTALLADHRERDFVLQVHGRTTAEGRPPASPAAAEGLV